MTGGNHVFGSAHNSSNCSLPEGSYDQDEAEVMMFPDIDNNEDPSSISQIQLRGRIGKHLTNNNSVITNFNPLVALDTQDNPNIDPSQYMSQQNMNINSSSTSHGGTQRHHMNAP